MDYTTTTTACNNIVFNPPSFYYPVNNVNWNIINYNYDTIYYPITTMAPSTTSCYPIQWIIQESPEELQRRLEEKKIEDVIDCLDRWRDHES